MSELPTSSEQLDLSVVLPAHNEIALLGSTVTNLVSGLEQRGLRFEVVIAENGSSDGTLRLARVLAAQIPQVRVLAQPRGDYGEALASGIKASTGRLVATFDVDYYDLSFLDAARELVENKSIPLVLASKRAPGASDRRPLVRRGLTAGFTFLLRRLLGLSVSDAHGMKLFDRAILEPCIAATVLRDSVFDVELVVRAERAGIAVAELPAVVVERRPPRSPVTSRALRTAVDLVRLRVLLGSAGASQRGSGRPLPTGRVETVKAFGGKVSASARKVARRRRLRRRASA